MLTLVLGRKKTGKTTFLFQEIKKKTISKKQVFYIVPEQMVFLSEKKILNKLGEQHAFLINAISFHKLAKYVLKQCEEYNLIKFLDKETKKLILNKVILKNKDKFLTFKNSATKTEFAEQLTAQFTELKKYCVDENILNSISLNPDTPNELKEKIIDITLILKEFNLQISDIFRDEDDIYSIAAKKIKEAGLFSNAEIYLDGFTGFTKQEEQLIKAFLANGANVTVTLMLDPKIQPKSCDIFYTTYKTKQSLSEIANSDVSIINLEDNFILNEEISHIENNIFRLKEHYTKKVERVNISSEKNSYFEVRNHANIIIEKIKENPNLKFSDFVVVLSDFDEYKKNIDTIFKEYKIPYYLNEKASIADLPVSNLISNVLDLMLSHNNLDLIFSYLKSGYFLKNDFELIYKFENFVISTGVKAYELMGKTELIDIIEKKEEYGFLIENKNELIKVYNNAILPLKKLKKSILKTSSAMDISKSIYEFIKDIKLESCIEEYSLELVEENEHIKASQFVQVYNAIITAIERTALVLKDEIISFKTYKDILSLSINNDTIKTIPLLMDSVMVTDVKGMIGNGYKYVVILGVKEGSLPHYQSMDSIINESDREFLNKLGISLSMSQQLKIIEEYIHIYDMLTCAKEGVLLSYPKLDFSLEEQRPSSIILLLLEMFPTLKIDNAIIRNFKTKEQLFFEAIQNLRDYNDSQYMNYFINHNEYSEISKRCAKIILEKSIPSNVQVSKELIEKAFKDEMYTAVTRLEKYRGCRFSYFVQYVLKGKEQQKFMADVASMGSLSHGILEKFSQKLRKDGLEFNRITNEYIDSNLDKIVKKEVKKINNGVFLNDAKTMFLVKKITRISKRTINLLKVHFEKGEFVPLGYEMQFGTKENELEGITINLKDNKKVHLVGVIDRVDVLNTNKGKYVRIIDYKSGYKTLDFYEIYNKLSLQLAVYLLTVLNQQNLGELKPGGMLYLTLDEPIVSIKNKSEVSQVEALIHKKLSMKGILIDDPDVIEKMDCDILSMQKSDIIDVKTVKKELVINNSLSEKEFDNLFNHVKKDISTMAEEIYSGNFNVYPVKSANKHGCAFCSYHAICGYEEGLSLCDQVEPQSKEEILKLLGEEANE